MHVSVTVCLVSVLLHELAHLATAKALRVPVKRVGISWKGPYIVREAGTPPQNLAISLAGPAANAMLLMVPGFFLINLVILVPNLFVKDSDGRRAWKCWNAIVSSKTVPGTLVVEGMMGRKWKRRRPELVNQQKCLDDRQS